MGYSDSRNFFSLLGLSDWNSFPTEGVTIPGGVHEASGSGNVVWSLMDDKGSTEWTVGLGVLEDLFQPWQFHDSLVATVTGVIAVLQDRCNAGTDTILYWAFGLYLKLQNRQWVDHNLWMNILRKVSCRAQLLYLYHGFVWHTYFNLNIQ